MATRNEAPDADQARADLDAIYDEAEGEIEGAEPVEEQQEATPPKGPEAPAEGEPSQEEAEGQASAEAQPPVPQQHPQQWKPPEGGQPFRFRADNREVEVPGALEYEHGIYVPKEAWNGVVSRHLADRDTLYHQHRQEVARLQQEVERRDPERHPEVIQSRVTLQKFRELMAQGPAAVAQWLDDFTVNAPLLEAQIELQTYKEQLAARQQQSTQYEDEQAVQQIAEQLPGYVEQNITALISQTPELASLKGSEKKLVEQLWPYIGSLLWEADRDYPEYGVARGQIVPRKELFVQALKQEADRRAEIKRLEDAARHNKRALGNGKSPTTVPARGRPTPGSQQRVYKPGDAQKAKDDFLEADLLAE